MAGAHRRAPRETLDPAGKSPQGCSAALCLCLWPPRSPWMMAGFSFVPLCSPRTSSSHVCGASSVPGTWLRGARQLSRPGCGQERSRSELQLWEGCPDQCFSLLSPLCRHFALDACCVQAGLCQERSGTPQPSAGDIFLPHLSAGNFCCFRKGAKTPTVTSGIGTHDQGPKPCRGALL